MAPTDNKLTVANAARRIGVWHVLLMAVLLVFVARAFYIQVVRYEYYKASTLNDQLKQYEIPAARGQIRAYDGNTTVPLVLNEKLFTVYADPSYIKEPAKVADSLVTVLGGKHSDYEDRLQQKNRRYVVLAKKANKQQRDKLLGYKYPGLGAQEQAYRTR